MRLSRLSCLPLLALALGAGAEEAPSGPLLVPALEVTLSDASLVRRLARENAWVRELSASNLSRGALRGVGPILFAVGTKGKDSWSGRLGDYLLDRVLDGRPVRVSYVREPGLVSPFGVTFPSLPPKEQEAARLLVKGLRTGEDVPRRLTVAENRFEEVKVTPVAVRIHKLAVAEGKGCLAVARDPWVAASLSRRAGDDTSSKGLSAVVEVDVRELFTPWAVVLERFLGVGPRLRLGFRLDATRTRLVPAEAELDLEKESLLGTAAPEDALLGAIPADAHLVAAVTVPDPGALTPESVEAYFREVRSRKDSRPLTLAFVVLGMEGGPKGTARPVTALLVPDPPGQSRRAEVAALFDQTRRFEVTASRPCAGLLVLSPSETAHARIASTCRGEVPSVRQLPAPLVAHLRRPFSAAALVNPGAFLASALSFGWAAEQSDREQEPAPPEITDAVALLTRLPLWAFAGRRTGSVVAMTGVER